MHIILHLGFKHCNPCDGFRPVKTEQLHRFNRFKRFITPAFNWYYKIEEKKICAECKLIVQSEVMHVIVSEAHAKVFLHRWCDLMAFCFFFSLLFASYFTFNHMKLHVHFCERSEIFFFFFINMTGTAIHKLRSDFRLRNN